MAITKQKFKYRWHIIIETGNPNNKDREVREAGYER